MHNKVKDIKAKPARKGNNEHTFLLLIKAIRKQQETGTVPSICKGRRGGERDLLLLILCGAES